MRFYFRFFFVLLSLFSCLFDFQSAYADGAWVLEKQWTEKRETKAHGVFNDGVVNVGPTSASLTESFSKSGQYGYSGKATCQANWNAPPKVMKPGETFKFTTSASTKGHDSRGGYYFGSGCGIVHLYVKHLDKLGRSVSAAGAAGIKNCTAIIGNGRTSASCNVNSDWQVPIGSPGQGLVLIPYATGGGGKGEAYYKYIYREKDEPDSEDVVSETSGENQCRWVAKNASEAPWAKCSNCPVNAAPGQLCDDGVTCVWRCKMNVGSAPGPSGSTHSCGGEVCPGAPSTVPTFSRWESFKPNAGDTTFAGQPGRTYPIIVCGGNKLLSGNQLVPGAYMISVAYSDPIGRTISKWKTTGPYNLSGGTRYRALLKKHTEDEPIVVLTPRNLVDYQNSERSMIDVSNDSFNWMSMCVYPVGGSVAKCCFGGTNNVRYVPDEKKNEDSDISGNWVKVLFSGKIFKGLCINHNGKQWPNKMKFIHLDKSSGRFYGEIEWTSLNSVHKIEGVLSGKNISFTETGYIKKGGAYLNCVYKLKYESSINSLKGNWHDPNHSGYYGTFSVDL